ncbi:MAG: hypothetical protein BGO29_06700 [Bacteroidales bacterium 36-12]|nr:MAG: hypothetical protein BGO29_06700 [Bacteroidales bacterium 36-12]
MSDSFHKILFFIIVTCCPIILIALGLPMWIYFAILSLYIIIPLINIVLDERKYEKNQLKMQEQRKKIIEESSEPKLSYEQIAEQRKQEWLKKVAEGKRLKKIQRAQPGGISGITDEEYAEMYEKQQMEKALRAIQNIEYQKVAYIALEKEKAEKLAKAKEEEKIAKIKEQERVKREIEIAERKEKEEKERILKRENSIKENIKRQILEKEKRKQLESEAIQELLDAGLIDNNFYSGINIREAIPTEVKISVWKRDKECCVTCGSRNNLEFDHIIPVSKGGSNTIRNIQILCRECNRRKSSKIM